MLWPEKREKDSLLGDKIPGKIDRTTEPTYLRVSSGYLPAFIQKLAADRLLPKFGDAAGISIGPIPAGTPIGLLANVNMLGEDTDPLKQLEYQAKVAAVITRVAGDLVKLPKNATDAQAREAFKNLVEPLLAVSKCPDLIVNRGHPFGTTLADADKRALVEFLKTF